MNREDLKKYIDNKDWIESKIELYKEQKQRAEDLKAVVIDGMPKAKNKGNYAIEDLIDKYNEIIDNLYKQQVKQNEIVEQIGKIESSKYRNILFYKYIMGMEYEEIATKIHYNYYAVCRQHGEALNEFDKLEKNNNMAKNSKT